MVSSTGFCFPRLRRKPPQMPEYFYVYPVYVTGGPRAAGRKVPQTLAIRKDITLEELLDAAKKLGFDAIIEEKHYPRAAHVFGGRLKVTKKQGTNKAAFLKKLSKELSKAKPS